MLPQNPYSRICNFGVNNRDHDQLLPALVPRAKLLRRYVMSTAIAPGEDPPVSMKATVIRRLSMAVGLLGLVSFGLVFPFPLRGRLWAAVACVPGVSAVDLLSLGHVSRACCAVRAADSDCRGDVGGGAKGE